MRQAYHLVEVPAAGRCVLPLDSQPTHVWLWRGHSRPSHPQRECPACGHRPPSTGRFCPRDGARLVDTEDTLDVIPFSPDLGWHMDPGHDYRWDGDRISSSTFASYADGGHVWVVCTWR